MNISKWILAALLIFGFSGIASADVLMLKDGQAITGKFQGGDQTTVSFLVDGQVRKYPLSEVNSITFTPTPGGTSASAPAPSYAAGRSESPSSGALSKRTTTTPAPMGVTIPAGTLITVRMIDPVDSELHGVGQMFRASLDEPLVVDGETVASRGADATVKLVEVEQAGRMRGRSELTLDLLDMTIGGKKYEVATSEVSEAGASRGRETAERVGVGAGLGAVIGAIAGGKKGAAVGAAAGAGAGTAVQVLTRGEQVKIPAESRLSFTLESPLRM